MRVSRVAVTFMLICAALPASALDLPWGKEQAQTAPPSPRPVVSVVVEDIPSQRRSFPGAVVADTEVDLGFQTLGRLSSRSVDVGDLVVTGDIVAELKPDDLRDNVRAARSAVEAAEVTLETAQSTAERTRDLAARDVTSRAALEEAERGLKSAEAGLAQARSELARAEDAEGFARLAAPFDGVVSAVFETTGAVVGAGTPIMTLSDISSLEAVIDLPETALTTLPIGTEIMVWLESDPDMRSSGRVSRIEALAHTATRTRRVHVALDDAQNFRLNALIRAQHAGFAGTVLTVPRPALAGTEEARFVWVVTRDQDKATVSMRDVTLGASLGDIVEITSGLVAGEEVVIRGVHSLEQGQEVGRMVER